MTLYVAGAYAQVQRLVAVVKMATAFEEDTTEEQCFIVHFCGKKDSMQRIFINRCSSCKTVHNCVANVSLMTKSLKRRCGNG
jgi:hypothetical protein